MTNSFKKAFLDIELKIKSDNNLLKTIEAIALLGSTADKEESDGWSDLDVLILMKSDDLGNIALENLEKLKQISNNISKKYEFPISILSHTVDDFEMYVSFEYLRHYSLGECTYPSSEYLKNKIDAILEKRKIDDLSRKAYSTYHMRHIRFNLLRKYISLNNYNSMDYPREFIKLLIDKMIKVTDLALNYNNCWPETKRDILIEADKNLQTNTTPLKKALEIRAQWKKVKKEEMVLFMPIGIKYLQNVIDSVVSDYQNPTPEERMVV